MPVNTPGGVNPTAAAAAERMRLAQLEKQKGTQAAQTAAQQSHHFGEQVEASYKDDTATIDQDTFVKSGQVEGTDEAGRAELYAKFNTDGKDGLSDAEFDAAFEQAMGTAASTLEVKSGDSLSKLAKEQGGDWQELYAANKDVIGDNPNLIQPGMQLKLPEAWVKAKEAKAALDQAAIDPKKPTHTVPDRLEEMMTRDRQGDAQTVSDARAALEQIPAGDPQRADYEAKVQQLEGGFQEKWGVGSAQSAAQDTITAAKINPEKPTHTVPDRAEELLGRDQAADQQVLADAEAALTQIPEAQRGHYQAQVDKLKEAFQQKWHPVDPKATIDDTKLPPPFVGPVTTEQRAALKKSDLDALHAAETALKEIPESQRGAYQEKVDAIRQAYQDKWLECPVPAQ